MFNPRKAAQVVAYLALKAGGRIDVLKVVKLVYLADRDSLKTWGAPILDEQHVSMPHGPVNSSTYSHLNGEHDLTSCGWSDYLEDQANHIVGVVEGVKADSLDELSEADIQSLEAVWSQFQHMTKWQIRDWTHDRNNVPEWEDPKGSSRPIPLERIMTMVGIENADAQADLIRDHRKIDRLFASLN
jgi:uncharacterized phage-associated protein